MTGFVNLLLTNAAYNAMHVIDIHLVGVLGQSDGCAAPPSEPGNRHTPVRPGADAGRIRRAKAALCTSQQQAAAASDPAARFAGGFVRLTHRQD